MNFILFAKIINILLVKLNSMYIQQRKIKYKRLIRATLILTPIFGVPYIISILTWYYVTTSTTLELTWLFFDQTFTSLQVTINYKGCDLEKLKRCDLLYTYFILIGIFCPI